MDKKAVRRAMGEKKRALTEAQIEARSAALAEKLYATAVYSAARSIYISLSFNQEVRTGPIIRRAWADGKRVAVPKVAGDALRFIWLEDFEGLREGYFGIREPVADGPEADDTAALVETPGLAFDGAGRRVGYGGGYYDRWLTAHPGHPTVALCYDFQRVEAVEAETGDVPVDLVLDDAT